MPKRLEQFATKAREYDARAKKAHNLQLKNVYEGFARSYRKLAVVQAKKGNSRK